ncbi:50S ribosomal protein L21 [Patescibacteria group bacterium]
MFAIIKISGKQYKVQVGDILEIAKIDGKEGETKVLTDVLLVSDDKKTKIGTPLVANAKVKIKILEFGKGEKLNVRRYKSKIRYRKSVGFRPQITKIEIISIA